MLHLRLEWVDFRVASHEKCQVDVFSLGAGGVLPGRQIESLLRVFKQFTHTLPTG